MKCILNQFKEKKRVKCQVKSFNWTSNASDDFKNENSKEKKM